MTAALMAGEIVAPVKDTAAIEKRSGSMRLVAITHGDPTNERDCGRPITYRITRVTEKRSADLVAVCPLHGDIVQVPASGDGYTGVKAFFAEDARPRRRSE